MNVKVSLNNLRISSRKSRQVIDLIRGKKVQEARNALDFTVKKATVPILKLLNSAVASALNDFKLEESNLFISKITADEGPKLKRSHPMSRGRAYPIIKRMSHITLILSDGKNENSEKNDKVENKKTKEDKIIKKPKVKMPARNASHNEAGGKKRAKHDA